MAKSVPANVPVRMRSFGTNRRQGGAFTLVSLVAALTVLVLCASIAGFYYDRSLTESRRAQARVGLRKVRDAYLLWQVRKKGAEPSSIDDLASYVDDGETRDPWGHKFVLDLERRLVVSLGPDGVRDSAVPSPNGEGQPETDDLFEELPPPAFQAEVRGARVTGDRVAPVITRVYPVGPVPDSRPAIGAEYTDTGSGVNPESVRLTVDSEEVTPLAERDARSVRWVPPTALSTGLHEAVVTVTDKEGNIAQRPWNFSRLP